MTVFKPTGFVPAILILTLAFSACQKEGNDVLTGTVLESDEVIISEIMPKELKALDTLVVKEGKFSLDYTFTKPTFLLLEFKTGIRLPILIAPGEKINLIVNDTNEYGTFTATGSASVQRMAQQRDWFAESLNFRDSLEYLNYLYEDSTNLLAERSKWNRDFVAQIDNHRQKLKAMIDADSTDLSNIMVFYQSLGELELFSFEEDFDYYRKVDNGLQAAFPQNEHSIYFHEQLEKYKAAIARQQTVQSAAVNIIIGNLAPEIELNDVDGNLKKLSDLRGKVVLIDFWASWCGPCRRANPELVALYKKYNAKGFDVFSVSLDGIDNQANAKNDWRFAIESDGLIWPNHVSDLKGYESIVIEKYGFEGIPFTLLLDRNGKIIAKDIRGAELEAVLKKVL